MSGVAQFVPYFAPYREPPATSFEQADGRDEADRATRRHGRRVLAAFAVLPLVLAAFLIARPADRAPRIVLAASPTHESDPRSSLGGARTPLGDEYDPFGDDLWQFRPLSYRNDRGETKFVVAVAGLTVGEMRGDDAPLDKATIRRMASMSKPWLFDCYREVLKRAPDLTGRLDVSFTIQANGTVSPAEVTGEIADPLLRECITRAFSGLLFRAPGVSQAVTFPLVLHVVDRSAQ